MLQSMGWQHYWRSIFKVQRFHLLNMYYTLELPTVKEIVGYIERISQ